MHGKKICLLLYSLYGGGAERVVLTLAHAFVEKGYEVDIVLLRNIVNYEVPSIRINVLVLSKTVSLQKYLTPFFLIATTVKLQKFLRNKQYAFIVSHSVFTSFCCRFIKNIAIIHCIHNSVVIPKLRTRGKANNAVLAKFIYNNGRLITVSRGIQEVISHMGVRYKSITTIYNPLNIQAIQNFANGYNVHENDYIIAVGRLHPNKRFDLLIEAYKRSQIEQRLIILGQGRLQTELEDLISAYNLQNRVILKGFMPNPYPYIKNARALVVSSDYEGFGLVLVEALILGTPVVSTNCPYGPGEILVGELSTFLSPVGDVHALAKNMQKVIENPPTVSEKHFQHFAADSIAQTYLNFCRKSRH